MSTGHKDNNHQHEKRNYYRVTHEVLFKCKVVDSFAAEHGNAVDEFDDAVPLTLLNELKRLDRDSIQTLRLLTEKNRLLGDYLQTLDKKVELLARHCLFAKDTQVSDQQKTRVNLSEDGVAFTHTRLLYTDSFIAVRMIFLPNYSPVISFAKVLRCESGDGSEKALHQVAAKFFRLSENDRQELSRQILKAQVNARKA